MRERVRDFTFHISRFTKRLPMSVRTLRKLRPWIQLAVFLLFVALLIGAGGLAGCPPTCSSGWTR